MILKKAFGINLNWCKKLFWILLHYYYCAIKAREILLDVNYFILHVFLFLNKSSKYVLQYIIDQIVIPTIKVDVIQDDKIYTVGEVVFCWKFWVTFKLDFPMKYLEKLLQNDKMKGIISKIISSTIAELYIIIWNMVT